MKKLTLTSALFPNYLKWTGLLFRSFKINLIFLFLFISAVSTAQVTPANCTQGCTSNDVQIIKSYLSDQSGVQLANSFVCPQSGTAQVYLTLELTTKTPRVGVAIFTRIRTFTPPSTIGAEVTGSPISQCFGIALNQATNKVTFTNPFSWTCGTAIVLTEVFIGWGTGNTNFCGTNTNFICPATPSKCYQLPNGSFIAIVTPTPGTASQTKCSTDPGGTTATFDLTESDNALINGQSGVHVRWYSDAAGTTELTGAGKTALVNSSNPQTVYAKVCNNPAPGTVCSSLQSVVLTVVPKPVTLVLTGSSICASAPGTGTVTSSTSESGVSYQLKNGSNVNQGAAQAGTGSGLTWTGLAVGTGYHVVATGAGTTACPGSSNNVDVTSVANPVALVLTGSSICASAPNTGTVTSSTSESGISYQLKNGSNVDQGSAQAGTGSGLTWTGLAAGTGYHVVATGAGATACSGGSNNVNVTSVANPVALVLTGSAICSSAPNTGTVSSSTSESGVSYQLKNGSNADQGAAKPGTGSGLTWTGLAVGNGYHVVSTGASPTNCPGSSNNVNVTSNTNPDPPSVTYNPPSCDESTFSITITGVTTVGAQYTVTKGDGSGTGITPASPYAATAADVTNGSITFSGFPAGAGFIVTVTIGSCTSLPSNPGNTNCGGFEKTAKNPIVTTSEQSLTKNNTNTIVERDGATVKAYPNPFNDNVKFVVTSQVAGYGSLELMNMQGQKIKTIYEGQLPAGGKSFEMTVPALHSSTFIYVLRTGGKQITGKLVQLNQ